jgi:uncharacterized protein (TIGR00251 family)
MYLPHTYSSQIEKRRLNLVEVLKMRITVDVKAEAHEEEVEKVGEDWYLVRVKAPKRKGKANAAVLKLLRKYFGVNARIVTGLTSTRKIIEIEE